MPAWGKGRGQSPEGGVDWCRDKVREEAELKARVRTPGAGMEADLGVEVRGRRGSSGTRDSAGGVCPRRHHE